MNKSSKFALGLSLIAIVIAVGGYFFPQQVKTALGAVTPGTRFPHGISIGLPSDTPTNVALIKAGTCTLIGTDVSQTATTSVPYDCAIAGIVSGDIVMLQISTSTRMISGGWVIGAAKASTTAGYATAVLTNLTGGNASPSTASVGSSTSYELLRAQ